MSPLSDRVISVVRTLVFGAWVLGLGWVMSKFAIPEVFRVQVDGLGQLVITWLLMSVLYPLLRKTEAKLPPWLTRILLGSNKTPTYIDQAGNGEDGGELV